MTDSISAAGERSLRAQLNALERKQDARFARRETLLSQRDRTLARQVSELEATIKDYQEQLAAAQAELAELDKSPTSHQPDHRFPRHCLGSVRVAPRASSPAPRRPSLPPVHGRPSSRPGGRPTFRRHEASSSDTSHPQLIVLHHGRGPLSGHGKDKRPHDAYRGARRENTALRSQATRQQDAAIQALQHAI